MKILIPPHKKQAKPVENFLDIKFDVIDMLNMISEGDFGSKNWKAAYAIHHAQVSKNPYNFFVVHPQAKLFGHHNVIINPKIIEKKGEKITHKEGCLSFPFRGEKKVQRYTKLLVQYSRIEDSKIETVQEEIEGVAAYVFQHELEHAHAQNIFQ